MATAAELTQQAARIGREHGIGASSMYFDGHEPRHIYEETLKGIDDGDPLILSHFPEPDLAGVWAFSYTADDLCAELGITTGIDAEAFEKCCDAYSNAYRQATREEIAWQCRHHLAADHSDLAGALATLDDDLVKQIATILAAHREGALGYPEAVSRIMDSLEAHKQDDHALADRDLVSAGAATMAS